MGNFYQGVAKCSRRIFCSVFSTQISEHFCVYLRLRGADHSDLGIVGKKHATSTPVSGVLITSFPWLEVL